MKFTRLPAHRDDAPQHWHTPGSDEDIFLIPGDALLTETLERPAAVKSRRQIKQWLQANPVLCQWDPQKERLLFTGSHGDRLFYWAVSHELWQSWQSWLRAGRGARYLLPDWMLLPMPAGGKFFALQADDTILFRHDVWSGGAIAAEQRALVAGMNPRWLSWPGAGGDYSLSGAFLSRQAKAGSQWRTRELRIPSSKVLSVLLLACGALLTEQSSEFIWLNETRTPVHTAQPQAPVSAGDFTRVSQTMRWLQDIQQRGPVQLQSLTLNPDGVAFNLLTPLSCDDMQARLNELPLRPSFEPLGSGCDITLQGGAF
ncbi:hypothetical protein GE278_23630 (plasmid) [Enterobacteriaceae bacterium Kacie_13]|nr:hypothetical protein GE278_23630 [Enterobacteriaceae bacterium Kacie_13]